MKSYNLVLGTQRVRIGVASLAVVGLLLALPGSAQAVETPVDLGTATSFAVLAGTQVTNTGNSVISGDLGVSPGSAVTGFPPGLVNNGSVHAADPLAAQAQAALTTAYLDAAGRTPATAIPPELGGQTLKPGLYSGGAFVLNGTLTLDGAGDPNPVFIFQAASSLVTFAGSRVNLINGASSCNVYWQVTSSATIGAGSTFRGTVLALTSISLNAGATVDGRMLARNGAVTLITNTIRTSPCAVGGPGPGPTTSGPTTSGPTTSGPTTSGPTTSGPITSGPTGPPGPQVSTPPVGPIDSGDGSTTGGGSDPRVLLAGALVFAGLGGAAVVAIRRRRRLNT